MGFNGYKVFTVRIEQIWSQAQELIREKLGPQNYEIWIRPIRVTGFSDDLVSLQVPNRYYQDWVQSNYGNTLQEVLHAALGHPVRLNFHIDQQDPIEEGSRADHDSGHQRPSAQKENFRRQILSSDKTFNNFVVGTCNQFAYAAASAVAESPGENQYNPLFIYGATGLGKTHLMHAIGNRIQEDSPETQVIYLTAEQFTNELISALRFRRMPEFRNKFRTQPTLLLMDDVQFLSGKDRTQEELFHTFEWLRERGRQIVFTADVLPREIRMFEPRLRTRCESGMLADTQPPDMETMIAILSQKAADMSMHLTPELAHYIASRVRGNIRELEGILNRLKAICNLHGREPTIDFARLHLGSVLADEPHALTPDEIVQTVTNFFNIKVSDLKGKRRLKQFVRPRHIAMWLIRKHLNLSFPEIGRLFGGRDHATIQHACKKVRKGIEQDADLTNTIKILERNLGR